MNCAASEIIQHANYYIAVEDKTVYLVLYQISNFYS